MKLATFNINGITSRLPSLIQYLEEESPDVVCLQELKTIDSSFPVDAINNAGYGALWVGQKSWNGVAVLAKNDTPLEIRRELPGDPEDKQARYLEVAIKGIVVSCLYLPNGNPWPGPKFDYKLAWFERFIKHANSLFKSGHPVALAGDYNVVPTDFDIYDPKSWKRDALLQPESRKAYERLLRQGWIDSVRHLHPDERIYTFWDYFRQHWQRNAGLRIDHILLNKELAPHLKKCGVSLDVRDRPKPSDHAPTWVELDLKGLQTDSSREEGKRMKKEKK